MDMTIFQIESNKLRPLQGGLLIASPFIRDKHFSRSVVLMLDHNEEGSMGIVLNKSYFGLRTLNEVIPTLECLPPIPLYNGGPVGQDTLFYLHGLSHIKDSLSLGNGLYLNGNFDQIQQFLLTEGSTKGMIRFFMGYAGWQKGQLEQEIEENTWIVNNDNKIDLLNTYLRDMWKETLGDLGGKYTVWSRYPKYPIMN